MKSYRLVLTLLGAAFMAGTACSSSDEGGTTQTGTTQTGTTQTGTTQTGTTQTGTTTGTGGGSGGCDIGDCDGCINTECANELCTAVIDVCSANPECLPLNECWGECTQGDTACFDTCEGQHPGGVDDLYAVYSCLICEACYGDCDGPSRCQS